MSTLPAFSPQLLVVCAATALACISLGGGIYEVSVVDPVWPQNPTIIQPMRGGISWRWFWIPAHVAFELTLIGALFLSWHLAEVRPWLLAALTSHATMRIWSGFDFIPKALAFERAEPASIAESQARRWTHRSRLRFVLDFITCGSLLVALIASARL